MSTVFHIEAPHIMSVSTNCTPDQVISVSRAVPNQHERIGTATEGPESPNGVSTTQQPAVSSLSEHGHALVNRLKRRKIQYDLSEHPNGSTLTLDFEVLRDDCATPTGLVMRVTCPRGWDRASCLSTTHIKKIENMSLGSTVVSTHHFRQIEVKHPVVLRSAHESTICPLPSDDDASIDALRSKQGWIFEEEPGDPPGPGHITAWIECPPPVFEPADTTGDDRRSFWKLLSVRSTEGLFAPDSILSKGHKVALAIHDRPGPDAGAS